MILLQIFTIYTIILDQSKFYTDYSNNEYNVMNQSKLDQSKLYTDYSNNEYKVKNQSKERIHCKEPIKTTNIM